MALQVVGFKWLDSVQADELGVKYEKLEQVTGRVNLSASCVKLNWKFMNALKLVAELACDDDKLEQVLNNSAELARIEQVLEPVDTAKELFDKVLERQKAYAQLYIKLQRLGSKIKGVG